MKKQKRTATNDNVIPYINRKSSPIKIVGIVAAVVIVLIGIVNIYSANIAYTEYSIIRSVTREDGDTANYLKYGDGYIRYSNDGIAYYKNDGTSIWNHTFEINNAQVKICEDYIVVGNISGRMVYIYNKSGLKAEIDAAMTVTQVDVAKQGVIAVSLEDGNVNYINLYDSAGTKLTFIKTSLTGDGYPVDMAISDDGTKLAVSYISVNGESLQTNLAFYNFSDVGQNAVDRLVGGFNHYGSSIVGSVEFVDNDTVIAIAEDRVSYYSVSQYPSLVNEVMVENEIQKITYSKDYVGLLFNNVDSEEKYKMSIYNRKAQKVSDLYFSEDYRNYEINGEDILLYNEKQFTLMSVKGRVKYNDNFDMTIEKIIPLDTSQKYLVFNTKYIQEIKLN